MEKEWFKTWFNSPYYHLLYFRNNEQDVRNFIDKLVAHLQPPPGAAVLHMNCGWGRHSRYLADKSFDVTGLDLSTNSIEIAKETERSNLHFFEQDMRLPYAANLFDYCFNFFTTFGYYRTQRENENGLRTMAQAIKPGGKLAIDYINSSYVKNHILPQTRITIDEVDFSISQRQDEQFFYKTIDVYHESATAQFSEQIKKYSLEDFTTMLQKQGMVVQSVFGNYKLAAYNETQSPRMIIIAERKK